MITHPYHIQEYIRNPIKESLMATCKLLIFLQPNSVIYQIISPKEEIVLCKECINERNISQTMFLRMILEKEPILSSPFLDCQIYISDAPFTLIPNQFWKDQYKVALSRLLLQDIFDQGEISQTIIPSISSRLLFPLPGFILGFLNQYLKHFTLTHIGVPFINAVNNLAKEYSNVLVTLILEKQIIVAAAANGNLKICNTYPYQSIADGVYFIQSARDIAGLTDKNLPHFVLGNMESQTDDTEGLWPYFPKMEFPELLRPNSLENLEIPWWKFTFLNA